MSVRRGVFAALIFWLGCDSCSLSGAPRGEVIAVCALAVGDVRSHAANDTIWAPLEVGGSLADGDWVRTAENATAQVRFLSSGSQLAIAPGSTVIIQRAAEQDQDVVGEISVKRGTVRSISEDDRGSRKLVVATPDGKKVRVRSAAASAKLDYRITVAPTGAVEVAVESGRAEIAPGGEEAITVAAGETREISSATIDGARAGEARGDTENAANRDGAGDRAGDGAGGEPARASGDALDAGTGEVLDSGAPDTGSARDQLREPRDGAEILFDRNLPQVVFTWSASDTGDTEYRLLVARTPDLLSEPILDQRTTRESLKTRALAEGTYYWGVYARQGPIMSAPRRLAIVRTRAGIRAPKTLRWN